LYFSTVNTSPEKKITDPAEALTKAQRWCAYQERSQQEVRDKLYSWGLWAEAIENIIAELISTNFISEERFAEAFVSGKFRIKQWGRIKIKIELKQHRISEPVIRKALAVIDGDEYMRVLRKQAEKKAKTEKEKHPQKRQYKLMRYLMSRGFEQDLVREVLGELMSEQE
jgi:regulatory protein